VSVIAASAMKNDLVDDDQAAPWPSAVKDVPIHVIGGARRVGDLRPRMGMSELSCAMGPGKPTPVINPDKYFPDGQIGLRTFGMTAWFDYVFYVETVPAL
jgi:hypothetical protein